jgi:hypothetical protein
MTVEPVTKNSNVINRWVSYAVWLHWERDKPCPP